MQQNNNIIIHTFNTPLGEMIACATEQGICLLEFNDRKLLDKEFHDIQKLLNATIIPGANQHLEQVQKEINEYFNGERKTFSVPLDTPGTDFQKKVWKELLKIPYGETITYKQQAILMGKPKSTRPIANANGHNRIAIIIPCHRVIGVNGDMTGYGAGIVRKKWLIEFESVMIQKTLKLFY